MNIIFNSLLAQIVKYDVHTTRKIKSMHTIFHHILFYDAVSGSLTMSEHMCRNRKACHVHCYNIFFHLLNAVGWCQEEQLNHGLQPLGHDALFLLSGSASEAIASAGCDHSRSVAICSCRISLPKCSFVVICIFCFTDRICHRYSVSAIHITAPLVGHTSVLLNAATCWFLVPDLSSADGVFQLLHRLCGTLFRHTCA